MSRQIGTHMRRICEIVECNPNSTFRQVADIYPEVDSHDVSVYLRRATRRGLLTADNSGLHLRYTVTNQWLEAASHQAAKEKNPMKSRPMFKMPTVSSVWDLAL